MRLTAGNNDNKVSAGCICDSEMWKTYIYIYACVYVYMLYVFLVGISHGIINYPCEFRLGK